MHEAMIQHSATDETRILGIETLPELLTILGAHATPVRHNGSPRPDFMAIAQDGGTGGRQARRDHEADVRGNAHEVVTSTPGILGVEFKE